MMYEKVKMIGNRNTDKMKDDFLKCIEKKTLMQW